MGKQQASDDNSKLRQRVGPLQRAAPCAWMPQLGRYGDYDKPIRMPLHLRALGWITVSLFCAVFYVGPAALPLSVALFAYGYTTAAAIVGGATVLSLVWPSSEWKAMRSVFQLWYPLFDFKHNLHETWRPDEADLNTRRYCIAMSPHGIVPVQALMWAAYCDQYLDPLYGVGAAADVVQKIPFLRNLMAWVTAGPADFKTLRRNLDKGKNLFIMPGGVAEIFLADPGRDCILIRRKRKGLMALCFKTGTHLVPAFFFGGNDFFSQFATAGGALMKMSRKLQSAITFFWGQWYLPIPYPVKTAIVMAEPIPVEKKEDPTEEDLDALLDKYVVAMKDLHRRYRAEAGYPNRELHIVFD